MLLVISLCRDPSVPHTCTHTRMHTAHTHTNVHTHTPSFIIRGVADQGLTRPKVLILLPFRESALRTVNMMIQLLLPPGEVCILYCRCVSIVPAIVVLFVASPPPTHTQGQVSHRKRFHEEFSEEEHLPPKTQKPSTYMCVSVAV